VDARRIRRRVHTRLARRELHANRGGCLPDRRMADLGRGARSWWGRAVGQSASGSVSRSISYSVSRSISHSIIQSNSDDGNAEADRYCNAYACALSNQDIHADGHTHSNADRYRVFDGDLNAFGHVDVNANSQSGCQSARV